MTREKQIERLKRVRYRAHNLPSPLREGAVDDLDAVIAALEAEPERGIKPWPEIRDAKLKKGD